MNKRQIEYKVEFPSNAYTKEEWLNKMAENRWVLVAVSPFGDYIFKRPVIDEYFRNLGEQKEYVRNLASESGSDYYSGYAHGLDVAYTMYVE